METLPERSIFDKIHTDRQTYGWWGAGGGVGLVIGFFLAPFAYETLIKRTASIGTQVWRVCNLILLRYVAPSGQFVIDNDLHAFCAF